MRARATHWLSGRDLLVAGEAPRGGECKELGWCLVGGHDTATERPHGAMGGWRPWLQLSRAHDGETMPFEGRPGHDDIAMAVYVAKPSESSRLRSHAPGCEKCIVAKQGCSKIHPA